MVTKELLEYIKTETAKGRTREEIHSVLASGGGWSEEDISEGFRMISPMQKVVLPEIATDSKSKTLVSVLKFLAILIILSILGFGFWYFNSQIVSLWNSLANSIPSFSSSSTNNKEVVNKEIPIVNNTIKDCGISVTPNLDVLSINENDAVLSCLGESALSCENAKGILSDDFFPTHFEIIKTQDSCNFKLSYGVDNTLTYITGEKLALRYISCPINIVKAIDNKNPDSPKFIAIDITKPSKYAGQIYSYGSLGIFIENNFDQNKIQSLGCSGEYIDSVIASYNLSQKK